jgi:hypothetical protein
MFYGIIIRMYYAPKEHAPAHIHVYYGEYHAKVRIDDGELIDGNLPKKQYKLVSAWVEIHKEDLIGDWSLAMNQEELFKIEPLR